MEHNQDNLTKLPVTKPSPAQVKDNAIALAELEIIEELACIILGYVEDERNKSNIRAIDYFALRNDLQHAMSCNGVN